MELLLKRLAFTSDYTEGKLYIDDVYFCDTLEHKDRGLIQTMPIQEIRQIKVYGKTAIPLGIYRILVTMSPKFKKLLPILLRVPGFEGIRIHAGNTVKDSQGCILAGIKSSNGILKDSRKTVEDLINILKTQKSITLIIEQHEKI